MGVKVAICETRLKPQLLTKLSSRGDGKTYVTIPSTIWSDAICDCPGFQYRGHCRHIDEVEGEKCMWLASIADLPEDGKCPSCGGKAIAFEVEPEL